MSRVWWLFVVGCGFQAGNTALPGDGSAADSSVQLVPDAPRDASPDAAPPPISFVQIGVADNTSATVAVDFPDAQLSADLNVVFVCWINPPTAVTVTSVTDGTGNTYQRALGPIVQGGMSQSVYYSCGVAATLTNTVTVRFSAKPNGDDVRIVEYSGIAASACYDHGVSNHDNTMAADSGNVTTSEARELLVAGNCTFGTTTETDPTYTSEGGIDDFGDIVEDKVSTAAGAYNATDKQNSVNDWVLQLVSFTGL